MAVGEKNDTYSPYHEKECGEARETNWKLEKKIIKYLIRLEKVRNTIETDKN